MHALLFSDYAANEALDTYSESGLDDRSTPTALSRAQRLAAERAMVARDRGQTGGQGARASRRSRAPAFLQSDDMDEDMGDTGRGLLEGVETGRRRRMYDERVGEDDMEDVEEVSCFISLP